MSQRAWVSVKISISTQRTNGAESSLLEREVEVFFPLDQVIVCPKLSNQL
jgi:hypothetical protein